MNTVFAQTRAPWDLGYKYQEVFTNRTIWQAVDPVMKLTLLGDKYFWNGFRILMKHKTMWKYLLSNEDCSDDLDDKPNMPTDCKHNKNPPELNRDPVPDKK